MPLLPSTLIAGAVDNLWNEVIAAGWGDKLHSLFAYFRREWVPRVTEISVFNQPERTNNVSESDNRSIANVVPQNHPNVWALIGMLIPK